jgi:nucleotide-binding universal stress UspA family protein
MAGDAARCVVVGYDGSDAARSAVLWALRETDARTRIVAVAALGHGQAHDVDVVRARWAQDGEDLDGMVELRIESGHGPAHALMTTARNEDARMIVIGHPHARRLEPLRDSVARDLLSHAQCPVVVVP